MRESMLSSRIPSSRTSHSERALSEKARVLIVDDDDGVLQISRISLRRTKFRGRRLEVLLARSAREAVEVVRSQESVGVMLIDGEMETKTSGLETCKAIREELGNQDLRIYLRTGKTGMDRLEIKAVREWDLEGHVPKGGASKDDLVATVLAGLEAYYTKADRVS